MVSVSAEMITMRGQKAFAVSSSFVFRKFFQLLCTGIHVELEFLNILPELLLREAVSL